MVTLEILRYVQKHPRSTAQELADEIGTTKQYIHNTIRVLKELELVETPMRGVYVITEAGKTRLTEMNENGV